MIELKPKLLWLLKATAFCLVAMLCATVLYISGSLLLSSSYRTWAYNALFPWEKTEVVDVVEDAPPWYPIAQTHGSIVRWTIGCIGAANTRALPLEVQSALAWEPFSFGGGTRLFAVDAALDQDKLTAKRTPNRQEWAVVTLSKALSDLRHQAFLKAELSYSIWQWSSLATVALGMITTVLVSLSSTEFGRDGAAAAKFIRIFAIIFPAVGTAAAAVVAFYGPQTAWTQSTRTLASAAQLHGQIALDVWRLKCADELTDALDAIETKTAEWEKQNTDIVALASASGQSTSASSQGSAPGPTKPSDASGSAKSPAKP
jgi:hypothetical protein